MSISSPFYADLHIHSKYSRACSRDCDLENLTWWARRKGITLVGTGDFTHPAWFQHLSETLVPAEPGLYRLTDELLSTVDARTPANCRTPVRFMLSVEISTIYKRDDATRKVHHLVYLPDLEAVARFNRKLGTIGNLGADGRPILGLDSRDLLEITLEASEDGYLVPAHIWTPWFAALGSKSGFDAIADCYADLADQIFAVETGLSSDPEMNRRVSSLDQYTLVSNSDAHSPPMLGREATTFDAPLDYFALRDALRGGEGVGTVEFFPEEGKYHLDGHRACDVRFDPATTRAHDSRCPVCGKGLTVGVLHRVEALADRPHGVDGKGAGFQNLIPLPEIVGELKGRGPKTKTVASAVDALVAALGPELNILTSVPVDDVRRAGGDVLAEAITRLRRGQVIRESGYDGEYGVIRLFEPGELDDSSALFDITPDLVKAKPKRASTTSTSEPTPAPEPSPSTEDAPVTQPGLDPEQRAAVESEASHLLVVAGPGTGKTRTLTHRISHLVEAFGVPAEQIVAITFTRRAADEMRHRLASLDVTGATVGTFHSLALSIVREQHAALGLPPGLAVADADECVAVLTELLGDTRTARAAYRDGGGDARRAYLDALHARALVELDELVPLATRALSTPDVGEFYQHRLRHVFVDEYQDVDEAQYLFLRALVPPDGTLCAIGDPDQAIYSFRGSDVAFFLRFGTDFPDTQRVELTRNYRSVAPVVSVARQVIAPSSLVPGRELRAMAGDGPGVRSYVAADEAAEAGWVSTVVDELVGGSSFHSLDSGRVDSRAHTSSFGFADVAVLYRTDAQAAAVMAAFDRSGVPYQKRSHNLLSGRPGVTGLLHELRLADVGGPVTDALARAAQLMRERGEPDAWSAYEVLKPLAEQAVDVRALVAAVSMGAEVDALDPRADAVTLLTMHAAKGLEFPVVFVIGCDDESVPLRFGGQPVDDAALAEERRLFFVALTRARQRLYVSSSRQRMRHGKRIEVAPSRFLNDVTDDLVSAREVVASAAKPDGHQLRLL